MVVILDFHFFRLVFDCVERVVLESSSESTYSMSEGITRKNGEDIMSIFLLELKKKFAKGLRLFILPGEKICHKRVKATRKKSLC